MFYLLQYYTSPSKLDSAESVRIEKMIADDYYSYPILCGGFLIQIFPDMLLRGSYKTSKQQKDSKLLKTTRFEVLLTKIKNDTRNFRAS